LPHRDGRRYVVDGRRLQLRSHCPLNLNCSTGRDHCRCHDRRDVARSGSYQGSPRAGCSAKSHHAAAGPAGGRSAAGTAPDPDQTSQHRDGPERWSQSCQLSAHIPELGSVIPTPGAVVQVAARQAARAHAAVVGRCELTADFVACGVARLERGGEPDPGPDKQ
jgi:hypothetical protein